MNLTKTPYLVLFILLGAVGVGTASALMTITLAGDVTITGDTTLQGDMTCQNCVDSGDLGFGAVNVLNINNDAVRAVHIQDGQVGSAEIDTDAVGSDEIADDAVGSSEIADDAVGSSEIAANAVGLSELAPNSVGPIQIGTNAVGHSEIANGAVRTNEILDGTITGADIDSFTSITATDFRFKTVKTHVLTLPAAGLFGTRTTDNLVTESKGVTSFWVWDTATPWNKVYGLLPVTEIPDGAVLKKLKCSFIDNDPDVNYVYNCKLFRTSVSTGFPNPIYSASATTLGNSVTPITIEDNSPLHTVDTVGYLYIIQIDVDIEETEACDQCFLLAFQIEYTVERPD